MVNWGIEAKVEDATRILAHYLKGSANENEDMHAELRDVVNSIIGAAVLTLKDELAREARTRSGSVVFPESMP